MIENYLTIAARIFLRDRLYTTLSVLGLGVTLTAALFVGLYTSHELSYDRFHERADDIYRLVVHSTNRNVERSVGFVPLALSPHLAEQFPSVKSFARVWEYRRAMPVSHPEQGTTFYEDDFGWAESSFFDLFGYEIVAGDASAPLEALRSVVISESAARRYFGSENPVGQTLHFRAETNIPLQVTAVMRDFPSNTHLHFDFVANIRAAERFFWAGGNGQGMLEEWQNLFVGAYLKLRPGAEVQPILDDATQQVNAHLNVPGSTYRIEAQPVPQIHLTSTLDVGEFGTNSSRRNLYAVMAVGVIILLLGGFNFVNLATARASRRAKEVGVRKTIGGMRRQIVLQHYLESALLVGAAFVLACLAVEALRPLLSEMVMIPSLLTVFEQPLLLGLLLGGLGLVVLLAGTYPALFLARFAPVDVLTGKGSASAGSPMLRRTLVLAQFAMSVGLIICTIVVYQQLQFMKQQDLGFADDQILVIPIHSDTAIIPNLGRLQGAYEQQSGVRGVTASSHLMLDGYTYQNTFHLAGRSAEEFRWERYTVEGHYPSVYDLDFIAGRTFRTDAPIDTHAVILNERAVRELGLAPREAVGRELVNRSMDVSGPIVGVVRDFHYQSLHEAIQPFVLVHRPGQIDYISVKIDPAQIQTTVEALKKTWQAVIPDAAFGYYFLDDTFAAAYAQEEHLTQIILALSCIAIFLACLGLFGLSMHAADRRTKEIGLRKVLGASPWDIVRLLGGDFTRLIVLAVLIAAPTAYVLMDAWLADFAYRIDMPVARSLGAGLGVLLLAWITIGYQTLRVVMADPVQSLRHE